MQHSPNFLFKGKGTTLQMPGPRKWLSSREGIIKGQKKKYDFTKLSANATNQTKDVILARGAADQKRAK